MRPQLRAILAAALVAMSITTLAAAVYASIPSPAGVVNGCYTNSAINGVHGLEVIDSAGACPSGTTALNWNRAALPGYEVVTADQVVNGAGINWNVSALCSSGKVATGGGFVVNPTGVSGIAGYDFVASTILANHGGWNVAIDYGGSAQFTLRATNECVSTD